jgi:hypothetical protein
MPGGVAGARIYVSAPYADTPTRDAETGV